MQATLGPRECEQPDISTPDMCFYERKITRPSASGKCPQGSVMRRTPGPGVPFCLEEEPDGYKCPKTLGQCSRPRIGGYLTISEAYTDVKK